jgi:hypothetical protein
VAAFFLFACTADLALCTFWVIHVPLHSFYSAATAVVAVVAVHNQSIVSLVYLHCNAAAPAAAAIHLNLFLCMFACTALQQHQQ